MIETTSVDPTGATRSIIIEHPIGDLKGAPITMKTKLKIPETKNGTIHEPCVYPRNDTTKQPINDQNDYLSDGKTHVQSTEP